MREIPESFVNNAVFSTIYIVVGGAIGEEYHKLTLLGLGLRGLVVAAGAAGAVCTHTAGTPSCRCRLSVG